MKSLPEGDVAPAIGKQVAPVPNDRVSFIADAVGNATSCGGARHAQKGFTLIEVVVALIILGLSLGAIFEALSVSRNIAVKADETLDAVRLAGNILANPTLIDTAIRGNAISQPVDGEPGWRFTFSAQPLEFDSGDRRNPLQVPAMYELKLCLFHTTDRHEKEFCINRWYRSA